MNRRRRERESKLAAAVRFRTGHGRDDHDNRRVGLATGRRPRRAGQWLVVAPYLLLVGAAWGLQTRTRRLGIKPPPETESAGRDKVLLWATTAEGVAIFAAIVGAQLLRRAEWIPPLIALIIGLHFLPLARALQRPYLTVSVIGLCLVAIGVPLAVPLRQLATGHTSWLLWCGIGSAAVLWATSAAQLVRAAGILRRDPLVADCSAPPATE